MKTAFLVLGLSLSMSALGKVETLSFQDHVETKAVVMNEILLDNLTQLYSDNYFDETMIAKNETQGSKKKQSWSEKLRTKLSGCPGVYVI